MFMKERDLALIRLYKGYDILFITILGKKLSQQYVGSFKVLKKVGRLAYQLDILGNWRVHPVFSIAQLEPCSDGDPYNRPRPDHFSTVFVEGDIDTEKSYEVERLLNKRVVKKGRGYSTQYLTRWKGYGSEHDIWMPDWALKEASQELIDDYEKFFNEAIVATPISPSSPSSGITSSNSFELLFTMTPHTFIATALPAPSSGRMLRITRRGRHNPVAPTSSTALVPLVKRGRGRLRKVT